MIYGITFGAWDLLHAGHILFFRDIKKYCDRLTVGLHDDPSIENPNKNKPIQSYYERMLQLSACIYVDDYFVYKREIEIIEALKEREINYYFVGSDHKNDKITGEDVCCEKGIIIKFIPRNHNYSSTNLRNRIIDNYKGEIK